MKKFNQWLNAIRQHWHNRGMYVIADAKDNSITFSKRLFHHLKVFDNDEAKIYVFKLSKEGEYAFILNPELEQETQLAEIQFNAKHKTIGFESLCPTVNRIFYDYGLPVDICCKLSVSHQATHTEKPLSYYIIQKPYDKSAR